MEMEYLIIAVLLIIVALIYFKQPIKRITVFEYEKGLKYSKGKFDQIIEPGQYWYIPFFSSIQTIDMRPRFVSITGQEVLSSDSITLKVSLAARYQIVNPDIAINKIHDYQEAFYLELQLALREIIGSAAIDNLLESRNEFSEKLVELTEDKIKELGLKLLSVNIKDIMFPGPLKQIFAQVVKARKEGQAALEKARGETAALRNLANAAKMLETHPNLMNLRLIQSLGESSGNTLVLGMPSQTTTLPIKTKEIGASETKQLPEDSKEES
jgi:regulator of protease activity HflC (stomatin/prohibitin superfamily)